MEEKKARTICRICHSRCPMVLTIRDGKITEVKADGEPLCHKGRALPEIVHAPDRLLHPMKREGDEWVKISWDEALDFIAGKLTDISERYGPQALAVHSGMSLVHTDIRDYMRRFCNLFGTPNMFSTSSQCSLVRVIGNSVTYGYSPVPDYDHTNCIMLWGSNPAESNPHASRAIRKAIKRGAKLIVVDPRVTSLAKQADIHLQVFPGTDRILALAMLQCLIREGLYDRDFVARWTVGFDKLEESLRTYDFSDIQNLTGVPADLIKQAADLYSTSKPACIVQGNSLEHHIDAVQIVRAISIIQTISGNLDARGGPMLNPVCRLANISVTAKMPDMDAVGSGTYPVFHEYKSEGQANLLADTILEEKPYPVKAMIISGGNPAVTYPNSGKVQDALKKLELLVVMDLFLSESAKHADIVLPAATFVERTDIIDQKARDPLFHLILVPAVIPEQGESWSDLKFWFELARRLGYGEYFPWKDVNDAISFRLEPTGITLEQLKNKPDGISYQPKRYKKYVNEGFATPSGKAEIYSERLEKLGYSPLPLYEEKKAGIAEEAVIFSAGARSGEYVHSRYKNIPSLRRRNPEPFAEMSPETARKMDLSDGEKVALSSKIGEMEIRVKLNRDILPGTVFVQHGWGEVNANILTDDRNLEPISGFPVLRSVPCKIKSLK